MRGRSLWAARGSSQGDWRVIGSFIKAKLELPLVPAGGAGREGPPGKGWGPECPARSTGHSAASSDTSPPRASGQLQLGTQICASSGLRRRAMAEALWGCPGGCRFWGPLQSTHVAWRARTCRGPGPPPPCRRWGVLRRESASAAAGGGWGRSSGKRTASGGKRRQRPCWPCRTARSRPACRCC